MTAWCFVLLSVHIGMHRSALSSAALMRRRPSPVKAHKAGRLRKTAALAAGVLVSAYGVYASFTHELGAKMVMYYGYSYWPPDRSKLLFFVDIIAIMGLYINATRCAIAFIRRARFGLRAERPPGARELIVAPLSMAEAEPRSGIDGDAVKKNLDSKRDRGIDLEPTPSSSLWQGLSEGRLSPWRSTGLRDCLYS